MPINPSRQRDHISTLSQSYPWIQTPLIICAPMRVIAGPQLASTVSASGGLGFIGPNTTPEKLADDLAEATALCKASPTLQKYVNSDDDADGTSVLPVGFGVLTWAGDLATTQRILRAATPQPCAAWLFAPRAGQPELDAWAAGLRAAAPGLRIWTQVNGVAEALAAARSAHAPDVLVLQGADAGGHSRSPAAGLLALVPEALDALAAAAGAGVRDVPVVGAGGIVEGRGVAAVGCLGAAGVVMGTRFLATREARVADGYREAVVAARDAGVGSVKTQLWNWMMGNRSWPEPYEARGLVNATWRDHLQGVAFEENQERFKEAAARGDAGWGERDGRMATYAGTGSGLVNEVTGAAEAVKTTREQAREVLNNATLFLG